MLPKIDLFGVHVTRATPDEMVREARDAARSGKRGLVLAAVNAHTYTEARRNPEVRRAVNEAHIAWPDGVPVVWAAKLAGRPVGPRIHGHDLMLRFLAEPFRHYFYGSTPEVLSEMGRRLDPARIAGMESPPFDRKVRTSDLARINDSGADILWVALGAPKQELWALHHREKIRVPIIACVGAAFEILAGRFTRAPQSIQRFGLEWAWRLSQDPARLWRRYFSTNAAFVSHIAAGLIAGRGAT
jgi:N-acetylglucosaminyldiphosphoundecaprenol N-acetyl-beta-D-mannosaminyltransferase